MTSIFICLLVTQKITFENVVAAVVAIVGVFTCKAVGLAGPAILVGAILGVVAAMLVSQVRRQRRAEDAALEERVAKAAGKGMMRDEHATTSSSSSPRAWSPCCCAVACRCSC